MSIKTLLQIILFLLILLIIFSMYFIYFYTGPLNKQISISLDNKNINEKTFDQDVSVTSELSDISDTKVNFQESEKKNINDKNSLNNQILVSENNGSSTKEIKNLTKSIEYVTTNKNGDIFKIYADFGITNLKNSDILDLKNVNGIISSTNRSEIYISSDLAKYNYTNQDSKFYKNVKITYDEKIITCDNFDINISEDIAVAYNNVIVKDKDSLMKAEVVTFDIVTHDININSKEKVKIISN